MRVLVAVDGSADGFEAVQQGAALLSAEKDQVALYYSAPRVGLEDNSDTPATPAKVRHVLAQAVFEEARKSLPAPLAAQTQEIADNIDPREGILAAAKQTKADMIVVGARGLGPLARLLLGSVSKSVVHASHVPVLVARGSRANRGATGLRVLLACDRIDSAAAMSRIVCNLTWPPGTQGHAITVLPGLFVGQVPGWLEEQTRSPEIEQRGYVCQLDWRARESHRRSANPQGCEGSAVSFPSRIDSSRPATGRLFSSADVSEPFPCLPHDVVDLERGQRERLFFQLGTPCGQDFVLARFLGFVIGFLGDLLYRRIPSFEIHCLFPLDAAFCGSRLSSHRLLRTPSLAGLG